MCSSNFELVLICQIDNGGRLNNAHIMTPKSILSSLLTGAALATANGTLVAYYPLDGDFLDASGNSNDGTMFGGVSYAGDAPAAIGGGQSAVFDGAAGTYGAVNTGLALTGNTNFTVSMWVKGDGTANSDDRIFSEGQSTNNTPLFNVGTHNGASNGTVDIYIRQGGGAATYGHAYSSGTAFDNTWRHVLFSGGTDGMLDLYIDGTLDTTFDYSGVPSFATDTTTIGGILRATDCCNFLGSIDDVSFWDQDLSVTDISALAGGASATSLIPEPSSALLSLAALLIAVRRRR